MGSRASRLAALQIHSCNPTPDRLHCLCATLLPQVDLYSWENPDFLPIFAAGNDGGKAKPGTMASPAGASRNGGRAAGLKRLGSGVCSVARQAATELSSGMQPSALPCPPMPCPPTLALCRRLHSDFTSQRQELPVCGRHAGVQAQARAGCCAAVGWLDEHSCRQVARSAQLRQETTAASWGCLNCHRHCRPCTCPPPKPRLQTANEVMETSAVKYVVWDATVTEGDYASTFK